MSEVAPSPEVASRDNPGSTRKVGSVRSISTIAITFVILFAVDRLIPRLVVALVFGVPGVVLSLLLVFVVTAGLIVIVSRAIHGRSRYFGAVTVTALSVGSAAADLLSGTLASDSLDHLGARALVVALCALTLGLFLGPWPLRVIGLAAAVSAVVLSMAIAGKDEPPVALPTNVSTPGDHELFEGYLSSGVFPLVTELPAWTNARVVATSRSATTWAINDVGEVITISVSSVPPESELDVTACTFIARASDVWQVQEGVLPEWCQSAGDTWTRPDNLGFAFIEGNRLIGLTSPEPSFAVNAGGLTGGSAEQLGEIVGSLRSMTVAEVDRYLRAEFKGDESLPIETPGL